MGCDIHGWVETKLDDKWVAVKELENRDRNYRRFAALAGVRGGSTARPLGVPHDVSDTAKYNINRWGVDGHSHSYMSLADAGKIFLDTACAAGEYERQYPVSAFFGIESDHAGTFRLVFWFDN